MPGSDKYINIYYFNLLENNLLFHKKLLEPVLIYDNETMIWKERESSRIRSVQMENLRALLGIRKMDSPEGTNKGVVCRDEKGGRKD